MKTHKAGSKAKDLHHYAKATLGTGDMRAAVKLPEHEDLNEWLAVHTVRACRWTARALTQSQTRPASHHAVPAPR